MTAAIKILRMRSSLPVICLPVLLHSRPSGDSGRVTRPADPRFYSYQRSVHRAEGDYGRHINAITLVSG